MVSPPKILQQGLILANRDTVKGLSQVGFCRFGQKGPLRPG